MACIRPESPMRETPSKHKKRLIRPDFRDCPRPKCRTSRVKARNLPKSKLVYQGIEEKVPDEKNSI